MKKRLFGSAFFVCALSLAVALALCAPAGATLFTSKAAYTGDWSEGTTWTNSAVPNNGDDVEITNAGSVVILSSASSNLNSLILGKTLTFTNWNTSLTATNVTILTNGVMTLPAAFSNDVMSNRVWIVCSNLTIAAGSSINADSRGYRGAIASSETTGYGLGGSFSSGGASYGGKGYSANAGAIYGDASSPTAPGSGGGWESNINNGGAGGGAIRIQASGAVTINGTITANGANGGVYSGSGSGGGIYITCNTLSGTNGVTRASGGSNNSRSGGGGGRIAVIYDTNAQASIPVPSVLFETAGGRGLSANYGGIGSLYFPDNRFLTETFRHAGQWSVSGLTNWAPNNLIISNGWLGFPADGFQLTVTNNLSVVGTNVYQHRLELTNSGVNAALATCGGNMFLTNAALLLGSIGQTSVATLTVGGNLILTNNAAIYVASGTTGESESAWGALITVTGDVSLATNATVYLYSHPTNGGSALVRARNLTLGAGGTISANAGGFMGRIGPASRGYGPGGGYNNGGGGYGGAGAGANTNYGLTYGNSNAPIAPGSAGGAESVNTTGGKGGGAVRIQVSHVLTINGTITANGSSGSGNYYGGGSGGAIYLACRTFRGNANGLLSADGGTATRRGGGGGRIAVWRIYDVSSGAISNSVSGGAGPSGTGAYGTVVWGMIPNPGTLFVIQ